jgi:two-component system, NtrC family, response regulator PilR
MAVSRQIQVMVVDDDADVAEMLGIVLRREGFQVHTALGCREALKTALVYGCDLLISDLRLADGDGCDLLRAVLALRHVPAVAVTGLADAESRQRAHRAGYAHVLAKPLTADAVLTTVRQALEERGVSL